MADRDRKPKRIEIQIEYSSKTELTRVLNNIRKMAHIGVENYKEEKDGVKYEYLHEYKQEEDVEIRFEEINGQNCMIIPSRIK